LGFRVQGSGIRVQRSGFRVQSSGFKVRGSGFRGSGSRVQGSGFRVQGSGFRVQGAGSGCDEIWAEGHGRVGKRLSFPLFLCCSRSLALFLFLSCSLPRSLFLSLYISFSPSLYLSVALALALSCDGTWAEGHGGVSVRKVGGQHREHRLQIRIHFINVMIRWTGLAPYEFEFNFSR